MKELKLKRDVLQSEFKHLKRDFKKGEIVYLYGRYTYGCISESGVACTIDGKLPFFELPKNAFHSLTFATNENDG